MQKFLMRVLLFSFVTVFPFITDAESYQAPIVIQEQGSFLVGGGTAKSEGKFNFSVCGLSQGRQLTKDSQKTPSFSCGDEWL